MGPNFRSSPKLRATHSSPLENSSRRRICPHLPPAAISGRYLRYSYGMSGQRIRRAYVVDDDEAFRHSLVQLLESAGWTVEAFAAPAEFLGRSAELEPGLLLLDLNLPGQSGLDLLEGASGELDRFAVIMVTGAGAIQTAVRTIRAGAIDFIEKPFRAAELFERLDAIEEKLGETLGAKAAALAARRRIDSLSPREQIGRAHV